MEIARVFKIAFRWMLLAAFLSGTFWIVWHLTGHAFPQAHPIVMPLIGEVRLATIASSAWDPLGFALIAGLGVAVVCAYARGRDGWVEDRVMTLVVVGFVGGLFGGIGVIDWAGHIAHGVGNSAPYIYLVLSVGGGLVMGIAAVISLPLRSALANAFLLPAAFTLTSVAFAAFKQGALFTLATVGLVGLVGAALAAALCLLTVVLLKWDVWAMLSRWLAAREPKRQSRTVREEIRLTETEIDGSAVAEIESINVELSRMDVRRPELERRKAELEKRPDSTRL